jgi:hypothetical protein
MIGRTESESPERSEGELGQQGVGDGESPTGDRGQSHPDEGTPNRERYAFASWAREARHNGGVAVERSER